MEHPSVIFCINMVLAALCGAVLGWEREIRRKPVGLRTNMLIALGSAAFTHASIVMHASGGDPGRIAAQIVTGIGFLGAGTIMRHGDSVTGLTSAATVWVVAALGMLAGSNHHLMALIATIIAILILGLLDRVEGFFVSRFVQYHIEIEVEAREGIVSRVRSCFKRHNIDIQKFVTDCQDDGMVRIMIDYETPPRPHQVLRGKINQIEGIRQIRERAI